MNITKNKFFQLAIGHAAKLAGKPSRIISLLAQLTIKIHRTQGSSFNLNTMREQFLTIHRMLRAHLNSSFKIRSMRILIILLAAIIYFINPLDIIPDLMFGIGLVDDLAVLTWVYRAAADEINSFKNWENSFPSPAPIA